MVKKTSQHAARVLAWNVSHRGTHTSITRNLWGGVKFLCLKKEKEEGKGGGIRNGRIQTITNFWHLERKKREKKWESEAHACSEDSFVFPLPSPPRAYIFFSDCLNLDRGRLAVCSRGFAKRKKKYNATCMASRLPKKERTRKRDQSGMRMYGKLSRGGEKLFSLSFFLPLLLCFCHWQVCCVPCCLFRCLCQQRRGDLSLPGSQAVERRERERERERAHFFLLSRPWLSCCYFFFFGEPFLCLSPRLSLVKTYVGKLQICFCNCILSYVKH